MFYLLFLHVYFVLFAFAWGTAFGNINVFFGAFCMFLFLFMTFFVVMWIGSDIGEWRRKRRYERLFDQ